MPAVFLVVATVLIVNVVFVGMLVFGTRNVPIRVRIPQRTRGIGPRR